MHGALFLKLNEKLRVMPVARHDRITSQRDEIEMRSSYGAVHRIGESFRMFVAHPEHFLRREWPVIDEDQKQQQTQAAEDDAEAAEHDKWPGDGQINK